MDQPVLEREREDEEESLAAATALRKALLGKIQYALRSFYGVFGTRMKWVEEGKMSKIALHFQRPKDIGNPNLANKKMGAIFMANQNL